MKDEKDPQHSTHIHKTATGEVILSSFDRGTGGVDRFNLTTGKSQTLPGEGSHDSAQLRNEERQKAQSAISAAKKKAG